MSDLYGDDIVLWCEQQADALRRRAADHLDWDNLAEEIEDLGRSELRTVESLLVQALRQGSSQGFSQVGQQVVGRSLNVQPTITIRPGFPVRIIVNRDLVLEPYAG